MAHQIRMEYERAAYPVLARGNQEQAIFGNDLDRTVWLETLGEACEKTGWRIHAWVMMDHHYHIQGDGREAGVGGGVRQRTTAGRRWVIQRLWMGEESQQWSPQN